MPATVFFNDAFGNVTLVIDPAGVRTTYAYNGFNQVTRRTDFNTGSARRHHVRIRRGRTPQNGRRASNRRE